ncbi:MAG: M14 family metallopeptidase, partial [Balneolaceae bacterium]
MKILTTLCSIILLAPFSLFSQSTVQLHDYLPDHITYDESIPTPFEILGHEVGEWHVTHDKLVNYMYAIADASDRVTITEYARTYENRPLLLLTFTSPENHNNIDQIKERHLTLTDPDRSSELDLESMPVVVTLGYSVHGNEPSGSNASLLTVYHFAAALGEEIDEILDNSIILIDPSYNPDGLNRFATWVNMHKSMTSVTDPASREFSEVWPNGRTNHYWFDLNRDWMPVVHPESRGRIQKFHEWRPNILTDHHEMGTNSTFFFQPGIPSRTHPLTPQINQELTGAIAGFHADYLDDIQSLYYTKESFDDFYYGKGSSYPDVFGTIGILFEQASSRGHAQESDHGVLEFPFTIKNQFTTSLSTVDAALNLRTQLHEYRRTFYNDVQNEASQLNTHAFVIGDAFDRGKNYHFADLMSHHNVQIYELAQDLQLDGQEFKAGRAFVIPTDQTEYKFIEAMFEARTEFTDSLFYDVSTWTLPFAFNLPYTELNRRQFNDDLLGSEINIPEKPMGEVMGGQSHYAYIFEWNEYYTPRALYRLQNLGIRTKVVTLPFTTNTSIGPKEFGYGSILIALGIQDVDDEEIYNVLQQIAEEDGIDVYAINRGLSLSGIDLGSPNIDNLQKPSVAILAGSGVSNLEVGEIWHLLDQRYRIPLTLLEKDRFGGVDLNRYNNIIMVNGNYNDLSSGAVDNLKNWIRNGGNLILQRSAINWARDNEFITIETIERESAPIDPETPYVDAGAARGAHVIGGSIFNGHLDLTHPLAYGYKRSSIHLFKNSTLFLEMPENRFSAPVSVTDDPLASGYISDYNLESVANTPSVFVSSMGGGRIISFVDNPNFRAFWYGNNKLFANALFFG